MVHGDELAIFIALFLLVTVIGFVAARWRRGDLTLLSEWGLAGRRFGSVVTWFLLGGDLYTAYTFVAVPALVFAKGAIGLFALPYTIIVYPIVYVVMPKLWQAARNLGHITPADYVRDRFKSPFLALLVAITGIVATMPYIALQIFGIQVVIAQMGINIEISLIVAFIVLALYTYVSGLRAPALIALVKDLLIWITVIVAVVYIPSKLGGFGAIFHASEAAVKAGHSKATDNLPSTLYLAYSTLAFGSALALFLYPHAITGTFSARSQTAVKRNAAFLPAYSFLLGLIALLGYMAVAAHTKTPGSNGGGANGIVPALLQQMFEGPFAGFAFAAIAIGALVPAAVMSIAAANLFTRNIWRQYIRPNSTSLSEEATVSKLVSLIVKLGALVFILTVNTANVINFQLAGGVWILQTLPAVILALYVKWLDRWAVVAGWAVGIGLGTYWGVTNPVGLFSSTYNLNVFGWHVGAVYPGLAAFTANLIVVVVGSAVAVAVRGRAPESGIRERDYLPAVAT
jgi:SSS family solute:Na+ symporter